MIIYSELTGETYKNEDECLKAEEIYKIEQEKEKKAKEEYMKALDKAFEEAIEACDRYLELAGIDIDEFEDVFNDKFAAPKKEEVDLSISDIDKLIEKIFG